MKISNLNRRITLLEPMENYDSIQGRIGEYEERKTVWAEFLKPGFVSKEVYGNNAAVVITQGIRIRPTQILKGWKVRDESTQKVYEVQHIDATRQDELILTTWEVEL